MEPNGRKPWSITDAGALALGAALLLSTSAIAQDKRVVTWNADYDPIPLAAAEALIADFEAANPEIDVVLTNFDHEAYKNAIRNFLTADPPDLANWYAANRMRPFVEAGPVRRHLGRLGRQRPDGALASSVPSSTIDGKQYAIPYTYYQWGIYYNRDAYAAAGVEVPGPEGVTGKVPCQLREVRRRRHRLRDHRHRRCGRSRASSTTCRCAPTATSSTATCRRQDLVDLARSPRGLRRIRQAAALRHREPCRHRLAGCGGDLRAGQGRELRHGQLRRRRLQGRRDDERQPRLHGVPGNHPRCRPRRRSSDRHDPPDARAPRTPTMRRRSWPTWPAPKRSPSGTRRWASCRPTRTRPSMRPIRS
jgi:hypothetical protein